MMEETRVIALDEFIVEGSTLLRSGTLIATFDTPIRELARLDDALFVVIAHLRDDRDATYMGANLVSLDLSGKLLWRAANLNEGRVYYRYYFNLDIFDLASPKLYAQIDDRAWVYLDPATGTRLHLDPTYDWRNYAVAWKQFTEDQKRREATIFARAKTFYPSLG